MIEWLVDIIIGSRFQAECIAGAVKAMPEEGEGVAVASPDLAETPTAFTAATV